MIQGAKKIIFTACHSGKQKLAFTSPDVISTSPQNFLTRRIDFTVPRCYSNSWKNMICLSGMLKTEFISLLAKSTSPGYRTVLLCMLMIVSLRGLWACFINPLIRATNATAIQFVVEPFSQNWTVKSIKKKNKNKKTSSQRFESYTL